MPRHRSWLLRYDVEFFDRYGRPGPQAYLELRMDLETVIERLPGVYGRLARLLFLEGMTHREAAKALRCNKNLVEDTVKLVRRGLR